MKSDNKKPEIQANTQKSAKTVSENKVSAECIVLMPIGYPFDFPLMEENIEISDKKLFEEYARDQWLGLVARKNSYLFDQKVIPDFGFKILEARPNDSIISDNTRIRIILDSQTSKEDSRIRPKVKISDVIGQRNAKNKIKVVQKYFENPELFSGWAPKNILFYGLPGTGKTMLAKALSSEVEAEMYLIKSTTLIGEHVGDAASKIHDLFEKASKNTPAVIFIDEIDAIGLNRSFQSLRGDVSEVVNSLLTELDGVTDNEEIITICATNNPSSLDDALRSRFEEEIEFVLPDDDDRREILERNLSTIPLEYDLDLEKLVKLTKGMSGRDLKEKILKTSLHNAIANDEDVITMKHIEYALKSAKVKTSEVKGMFE